MCSTWHRVSQYGTSVVDSSRYSDCLNCFLTGLVYLLMFIWHSFPTVTDFYCIARVTWMKGASLLSSRIVTHNFISVCKEKVLLLVLNSQYSTCRHLHTSADRQNLRDFRKRVLTTSHSHIIIWSCVEALWIIQIRFMSLGFALGRSTTPPNLDEYYKMVKSAHFFRSLAYGKWKCDRLSD